MRLLAAFILVCSAMLPVRGSDSLDVTTFVVLGDGLTAGMRNSRLYAEAQKGSFPALAAGQMQAIFPLPLINGPGLSNLPGQSPGRVDLPSTLQTTVREFPPNLFVFNLSVPGFGPDEALTVRPAPPLIDKTSATRTAANFILGFPSLILNRDTPYWTQVEYAQSMHPTLILVALGYDQVFSATIQGRTAELGDSTPEFAARYREILDDLSGLHAQTIVAGIPSPIVTPYFATLDEATRLVGVPPEVLETLYALQSGDRLTLPGLYVIANQLLRRKIEELPAGSVLPKGEAAEVETTVAQWNQEIAAAAEAAGAHFFDLASSLRDVRQSGLRVAEKDITADYLGGFYSLDGVYPGALGQAAIANEFLTFVNREFGTDTPLLPLSDFVDREIAMADSSALRGVYSVEQLESFIPDLRRRLEDHRIRRDQRNSGDRKAAPRSRTIGHSRDSIRPGGGQ